ncbi:hypothetical protein [Ferruginibacter sp.]
MENSKKFEITDALLIGYISVISYLFLVAKELGYLQYFNIPSYFLNFNILESIQSLLLSITSLLCSYLLYKEIFDRTYSFEATSLKKQRRYILIYRPILSVIVPFGIYWLSGEHSTYFFLYFSLAFLLFSIIGIIELEYLRQKESKLIRNVILHSVWIIASFIIFWSLGRINAKTQDHFFIVGSGKNVVIYFSNNKIILKPIIGGKISNSGEFLVQSLSDTAYYFKSVNFKR